MPAWITPTLLAATVNLWSKRYARPVDYAEAVEILVRVGRLMDVLKASPSARPRAEVDAPNRL